jgi:starch synthase
MPIDSPTILFVTAEAAPMVKVGGLADVASALPKALRALGYDVRLMMPAYGTLDRQTWDMQPDGKPFAVTLGGEPQAAAIYRSMLGDVPVYYVDHAPTFSSRPVVYTSSLEDPARFVIFCNLVLSALSHMDWRPDVLHLNDWPTAILARWLNALRADLHTPPALLTVHNLAYQGIVYRPNLGWAASMLPTTADQVVNLLYEGIAHADMITTVSPTYTQEIMTPEHGAGLHDLLRSRAADLVGILNGIDVDLFDPATDRCIPANYNVDDLSGKRACKRALQTKAELPERADLPLFGMVSRLVEQKGIDILAEALPVLLNQHDFQLVILGTGKERYHDWLNALATQYPHKFRLWLQFDPALAQQVYAGSDVFVMPSLFEPCGLGQMIAMRYGTLPLVRATGGLADTVTDMASGAGTGFRFEWYAADALISAFERAIDLYRQPDTWCAAMQRAMRSDFWWTASARRYGELYECIISRHRSF